MPQIINTNIASLNAQRNLDRTQSQLNVSLQRLSTGLRINSAKDDAAGLAISERFTTQIRGLSQAIRNSNDGISFAQTAEGALSTVGDALQRMRELAVQSANDTNTFTDRQALNNEVSQLVQEVNRIANNTQFNGQNILDGSLSTLVFQVGAQAGQTISVTGVDSRGSQLGAAVNEGASFTNGDITAAVTAGNLVVQGEAVTLTGATTQNDVIAAINAVSVDSGVTARAASDIDDTLTYTANAAATTIQINGVSIGIAAGSPAIGVVVDAVNAVSNQTGVSAANNGGNLQLLSNSNTPIEVVDDATNNILGGDATIYAGIDLTSDVGVTITTSGTPTLALGTTTVQNILNDTDVLTRTDASNALNTLDFALQQVSDLRSELGAVQIRFESTITNLSISVENQTAARSRIQDADFAAETAQLTRGQILQQAGLSILAQANLLPQGVLALLQ